MDLEYRPWTPGVAGSSPACLTSLRAWCNGSIMDSKSVDGGSTPLALASYDKEALLVKRETSPEMDVVPFFGRRSTVRVRPLSCCRKKFRSLRTL